MCMQDYNRYLEASLIRGDDKDLAMDIAMVRAQSVWERRYRRLVRAGLRMGCPL